MKADILRYNIQSLKFQRNALLALCFLLAVSLFVSLSLLWMKKERIVVVPPVIEKEFWLDGNGVSSTYLEQFGVFLSKLILEKTPQSAGEQRKIVLRHTDPNFSSSLNHRLQEEETLLKKQNASYVFYPIDVRVDPKKKLVFLSGERVVYVSNQPISQEKESYILGFSFSGSRLLLNTLQAGENPSA